jgi:hypothetical protein
MLDATLLIALPLLLTVALDQVRVPLAALFLVAGMLVPPLLLAVADNLAILRIRTKFLPVIFGAAPTLTLRLTADDLLGTICRRQKNTLAVGTTAGLAQADSSGIMGMNL